MMIQFFNTIYMLLNKNMYNIMHITKSITACCVEKNLRKKNILLLHTKINTYYIHILLNLVTPW